MQANDESLISFAKELRKALDTVDSSIRMGYCSCMTNWDNDGTDPVSIAKALAGDTIPFLRLIGAPYWHYDRLFDQDLQGVIEVERLKLTWAGNQGVEITCEGDAYPHISHYCKVSHMEVFHTAMLADGRADGYIKYMITYNTSHKRYNEKIASHIRNMPLYKDVSRIFDNKTAVGVRIFEFQHKLENMDLPEEYCGNEKIAHLVFSQGAKAMAALSIPTTYDETECPGVIFGENAKYVTEENLKYGAILDLDAAKILEKRGIDTELAKIGESLNANGGGVDSAEEYYVTEDDYAKCFGRFDAFATELKEGATVESYYVIDEKKLPNVYTYENKDGLRFLVIAVKMFSSDDRVFKHILRQLQFIRYIECISRKPLPAVCSEHPELYMMVKRNGKEPAVELWNLSDDGIESPIIMDKNIENAEFINCAGSFKENIVNISPLQPHSFAFFNITEELV